MSSPQRLELSGAPGSPYTRKMVALLRYRHIPYTVYWGTTSIPDNYPTPKPRLLPTFYFPDDENGGLVPVTDSTPIIRRLEHEYAERSVIPSDPALAFLNALIEDYADEWLTKAMFHFRWAHEADWKNAAPLLVFWNDPRVPADAAEALSENFARRQIERLYVVGSNPVTAQTIEASFARLIQILDALIERRGFVLGGRPASADFALFGQLTQLGIVEPTSAAILSRASHRVRSWIDRVEDLSGVVPEEQDWFSGAETRAALAPLLTEIGRTYVPAMRANAAAISDGNDRFETEIDGRAWTQPVFKYQAKCLNWLRADHAALAAAARSEVDATLAGTGCDLLFQDVSER